MNSKARTLWQLMAGYRLRYLAAIAAMIGATELTYFTPRIWRGAIDGILVGKDDPSRTSIVHLLHILRQSNGIGTALIVAAAALVGVIALAGVCMYFRTRWSATASENIIKHLRERLYNHLQHVPMSYHDKAQTGDLVQRCTSDVETVRTFYTNQVVELAQSGVRVLIVVPILLAWDWRLALVSLALMPLIVGFAIFFFSRVGGSFKRTDEAEGAMSATLQENLTGIRVVRAFARQQFEIDRFRDKNETHRKRNWHLYTVMASYWACSDFLCFCQMALVLLVGAHRVLDGAMSIGTLVGFLLYAQMFIWPIRDVGRVLTDLGKSVVSIGRIEEILNVAEEQSRSTSVPAVIHGREARATAGRQIVIEHLNFSHGSTPVLTDVNLTIPAGSTLALLGPSGSGKTTLVNLLLRMYDYDSGSIRLDGTEIKDLPRKYVRQQFGVVMQEPFLYSKTLRDNIKVGRHNARDDEMLLTAQVAAIHETIQGFDKQYDTLVGERGVTLSGGQRQRTAIARALLRDAPILILDDALSAVDTQTENTILNALKRHSGRHTVLLIAHRLSTLMHADQIAVIEQGRIVQLGTHEQLAEQEGLYRRLWLIQNALQEDLQNDFLAPADHGRDAQPTEV